MEDDRRREADKQAGAAGATSLGGATVLLAGFGCHRVAYLRSGLVPFELKDPSLVGPWLWPVMSKSKAKEYRASAEECDRQAQATDDPETKIKLTVQARRWRELEIWAAVTE
jgi:hypothetical protein